MSTLKVTNLQHASSGSASITLDSGGTASFNGKDVSGIASINGGQIGGSRNLATNGAMTVAQRGASTSGVTTSGYYGPDRFQFIVNTAGTWTVSQASDGPDGFARSYGLSCTTADASLAAGDYVYVAQILEGQDLQQLKKGTADAVSVTLSFWVKSSKTGTYTIELRDVDNGRHIASTYTVDAANTWEYKTITYAGDATGAFTNDNNASLYVNFWLAAGSQYTSGSLATSWASLSDANRVSASNVNLADSTSNNFYITGVQLEVGSQATPFEHRPYGDELARCQRYYWQEGGESGVGNDYVMFGQGLIGGSGKANTFLNNPVIMRAEPTLSLTSASNGFYVNDGVVANAGGTISPDQSGTKISNVLFNNTTSMTTGNPCVVYRDGTVQCIIKVDAEL